TTGADPRGPARPPTHHAVVRVAVRLLPVRYFPQCPPRMNKTGAFSNVAHTEQVSGRPHPSARHRPRGGWTSAEPFASCNCAAFCPLRTAGGRFRGGRENGCRRTGRFGDSSFQIREGGDRNRTSPLLNKSPSGNLCKAKARFF